jgi:hypothetical protein
MYVATKLGRRQDGQYGWPQNFTYDVMRLLVESSLKNLDIGQLFWNSFIVFPPNRCVTEKYSII